MNKCKVLFFAANPIGMNELALDEESREIDTKIRSSEHRDSLELVTKWAVRPDDLLQNLNQHRPSIVHFSGHGSSTEEIILLDAARQPKPVTAAALRQLFLTLKDNIRIVVLNACYSRPQAKAITGVIDCAIGMKRDIGDRAAIVFAASFYRAIGFGRSVQEAFDQGKVSLLLEGIPEDKTPELLFGKGVDPTKLILLQQQREIITTIEFTLDRPLADFDPEKFKAALKACTGADITKVHIASIRSGSTKVSILGDPEVLEEIISRLKMSPEALRAFAEATGLQRLDWDVSGTRYQLAIGSSRELDHPHPVFVSLGSEFAEEVETLLERVRGGDSAASGTVIERVYPETRRLANALLVNERQNIEWTDTDLTNLLWIRLLDKKRGNPLEKVQSSRQLLRVAVRNMREILVDYARERSAQKRPQPAKQMDLEEALSLGQEMTELKPDIIDMHDSLKRLEKKFPTHAQALELKYFLGLTNEEGADALETTVTGFRRLCDAAIAFLTRDLKAKRAIGE